MHEMLGLIPELRRAEPVQKKAGDYCIGIPDAEVANLRAINAILGELRHDGGSPDSALGRKHNVALKRAL
jgi:hypothetical protein